MLFVSSLTTAICFFSNIFSALVSIADFGSYMGMVVVLNYLHVMTILPSAILVNELHIKPFQRTVWRSVCSKIKKREELDEHTSTNDADQGIVDSSSSSSSSVEDLSHHSVEEGRDELTIAETGVPASSSSPSEELWQKNGRDITTAGTITSSNEETPPGHIDEVFQQPGSYKFLDHTEEMTALDRYFVLRHAPFIHKWRKMVVLTFLILAITLGVLGYYNFALYDGTIIVFKEKYNLGRVQRVIDKY